MRLKSFSIFIIELAASKIIIAKSPRTTVIQTLQKQSYAILKFKFSIWPIKFTAILPQMEAMAQIHLQQCFFDQTISISIPIAIKIFSTQSEFRFGRTTEQTAINNWQIHHSEDSKFRFGRTTDRQPVSLQNNHLAPAIINPPLPLPLINHHYQRHFSQNRSIQQRCHA